jgi:hypothetical protein
VARVAPDPYSWETAFEEVATRVPSESRATSERSAAVFHAEARAARLILGNTDHMSGSRLPAGVVRD